MNRDDDAESEFANKQLMFRYEATKDEKLLGDGGSAMLKALPSAEGSSGKGEEPSIEVREDDEPQPEPEPA